MEPTGMGARWRAFWEDTRAIFRETPHLRTLLLANLLSQFNQAILITVMPFYLQSKGLSLLQLGGVYSMIAVSTIGVDLLAGRYYRFFGRREVVVSLLLLSVLLFPAYLFVTTPLQFLALSAVSSFAGAAAGPGLQVLIAEVAVPRRRATIFGYMGAAGSFSYAVGIMTAGFLMGVGYAVVFYVATLLALTSFAVTASFILPWRRAPRRVEIDPSALTEAERALHEETRTLRKEVQGWVPQLWRARAGLQARFPRPRQAVVNVRWAGLYLFLFTISLSIYPVYFPFYLHQQGLPLKWVGVVVASSWLTFAVCQPFGGRFADRTGKHREIIAASLLCAALLNLVMSKGSLPWVIAAWAVLGIADGIGRPVTDALIVESVTRAGRGSAFGWTSAASQLARVVAPYGLALLIRGEGISQGLFYVSFTIALAAVPLLFIRRLPQEAPAPLQPAPTGGAA